MRENKYYGIAQACTRGHVITIDYDHETFKRMNFCSICSAPTITKCPTCNHSIRGGLCEDTIEYCMDDYERYNTEEEHHCYSSEYDYHLPSYCEKCGHPFPWTERKISYIKDELSRSGIEDEQIRDLIQLLPDLITENMNTQYAVKRFQKIVGHLKRNMADYVKEIFVEVMAEGAKRMIYP